VTPSNPCVAEFKVEQKMILVDIRVEHKHTELSRSQRYKKPYFVIKNSNPFSGETYTAHKNLIIKWNSKCQV
jgi:hypothetical protein